MSAKGITFKVAEKRLNGLIRRQAQAKATLEKALARADAMKDKKAAASKRKAARAAYSQKTKTIRDTVKKIRAAHRLHQQNMRKRRSEMKGKAKAPAAPRKSRSKKPPPLPPRPHAVPPPLPPRPAGGHKIKGVKRAAGGDGAKRALSPYNLFVKQHWAEVKARNPGATRGQLMTIMGAYWKQQPGYTGPKAKAGRAPSKRGYAVLA